MKPNSHTHTIKSFQMNIFLSDLSKVYNQLKTIDDKTMQGLAYFYTYDILHHAFDLLKHTKRLSLFRTHHEQQQQQANSRKLYQFHANKNQVPVYTLTSSNFCTCSFYKEHILTRQDYFTCPHNLAIKLYETIFQSNNDIDIEIFDVDHEYLIDKMSKLTEQSMDVE